MQQKNQQQPKNQAPAHQAGQTPQPGKQGQQGNQPGNNPNRHEEFPGKAPDVYSDPRRRAENPDADENDPKRHRPEDERNQDRGRRNA